MTTLLATQSETQAHTSSVRMQSKRRDREHLCVKRRLTMLDTSHALLGFRNSMQGTVLRTICAVESEAVNASIRDAPDAATREATVAATREARDVATPETTRKATPPAMSEAREAPSRKTTRATKCETTHATVCANATKREARNSTLWEATNAAAGAPMQATTREPTHGAQVRARRAGTLTRGKRAFCGLLRAVMT
jgi:hypothetical protein